MSVATTAGLLVLSRTIFLGCFLLVPQCCERRAGIYRTLLKDERRRDSYEMQIDVGDTRRNCVLGSHLSDSSLRRDQCAWGGSVLDLVATT